MNNRTDFNAEFLEREFQERGITSDMLSSSESHIKIQFHKHFEVLFEDDYCSYFNQHWHPCDNQEALKFVDDLMNEEYIFYHRYKFPYSWKMYKKHHLPKLLKRKDKKHCRVYSAIKIYVDN